MPEIEIDDLSEMFFGSLLLTGWCMAGLCSDCQGRGHDMSQPYYQWIDCECDRPGHRIGHGIAPLKS